MTRPRIRKSLEDMQALCVSVIFAEHSFRDNLRNTRCSNATAINCRNQRFQYCQAYWRLNISFSSFSMASCLGRQFRVGWGNRLDSVSSFV